MTATSTNFGDILNPQISEAFDDEYPKLADRIGDFFRMGDPSEYPGKDRAQFTEVGGFGDMAEFTGTLLYDDVSQGYDRTMVHKVYAKGFQVERTLFEDDLLNVILSKPRDMADAYVRTRQKHGASIWNNAFSVDSTWLSGGDGQALCADAHTTTDPSVSTASGFDNLVTTAFSATALVSARIQFRSIKDLAGNIFSVSPDFVLHPKEIYDTVYEVLEASGKPGVTTNDPNVHKGGYTYDDWEYLTDTNNWFLIDKTQMKKYLLWIDRVPKEFGMVEDFDTFNAKWRLRCRYSLGALGWRWLIGAQVS